MATGELALCNMVNIHSKISSLAYYGIVVQHTVIFLETIRATYPELDLCQLVATC